MEGSQPSCRCTSVGKAINPLMLLEAVTLPLPFPLNADTPTITNKHPGLTPASILAISSSTRSAPPTPAATSWAASWTRSLASCQTCWRPPTPWALKAACSLQQECRGMVLWEEQVGQGSHGHPAQDFATGAPDLDAAQRWVLNCVAPSLQAGAGGCPPPSPPHPPLPLPRTSASSAGPGSSARLRRCSRRSAGRRSGRASARARSAHGSHDSWA